MSLGDFVVDGTLLYNQIFFTYLNQVLSGISFFVLLYRECYRLQRVFFRSQAFFTLHSFPTFGISTTTMCFYQGFSQSWQLFLEGCRVFHCGSKYRPVPSVCLYPIVFSKRYYSLDSILYVTFNREALYITLAGFVIHSLKAPYVASSMSYLLANRSFW